MIITMNDFVDGWDTSQGKNISLSHMGHMFMACILVIQHYSSY